VDGVDSNHASDVNQSNVALGRIRAGRYSVLNYNGVGDGVTDDSAHLVSTDSANGGNGVSEVPAANWRVASNTTLAHALTVPPGALLKPDAGVTLMLNGPLDAGDYQIFGGAGTVALGAGAAPVVLADWFGMGYSPTIDDSGAINKAAAAVHAAGGGTVRLAAGRDAYINASIVLHDTTTLDIPQGARLRMGSNTTIDMITNADHVNGNVNVTITGGGEIDGRHWCNNCISAYGGSQPSGQIGTLVRGVRVHDAKVTGIQSNQASGGTYAQMVVRDCNIYLCGSYGIDQSGSDGGSIIGNVINQCVLAGIRASVVGNGPIIGNDIYSCGTTGIAGVAIDMENTSWVLVLGNQINSCSGHGIKCQNGKNNVISGNSIINVSTLSNGTFSNIFLFNEAYDKVIGNTLHNYSGPGIAPAHGVNESGTSDYNVIQGNTFDPTNKAGGQSPWTGALVTTVGVHSKASGNPGYNPAGVLASPAIPASTVTLRNPFGVDCMVNVVGGTVSAIGIGPVTPGTPTGATSGWIPVAAGQGITLTYSVVPTWLWIGN
jgi:hypothetical protein